MTGDARSFGLDLVRTSAILLVLLCHCSMQYAWAFGLPQPSPILVLSGFLGVELFFVLSGFLICAILSDIHDRGWPRSSLRRFFVRRWMRTLPAYFIVLALVIPATGGWPLSDVARFATFTQSLTTAPRSEFQVSWSLAVEEWFYIAFPVALVMLASFTRRRAIWPVVALFMIVPPIIRALFFNDAPWDDLSQATVTRIDAIVYGCAMYRISRNWTRTISTAIFVAGAVGLIALWLVSPWGQSQSG